MNNSKFVNVFNSRYYLLIKSDCFKFFYFLIIWNMLKEFSARAIFHNQVQIVFIFYHFIKLNNMRMSNLFKYYYFSIDSFHIWLIHYFILFKNFNCNFVSCFYMSPLFHLSECTFPLCFSYYISTYLFPFLVLFFFSFLYCRRFNFFIFYRYQIQNSFRFIDLWITEI